MSGITENLEVALKDAAFSLSFDFNGAFWLLIIRKTAKVCGCPRVDVYENGRSVGTGYLPSNQDGYPMEDGPMFDGSHNTTLFGDSIESADEEEEGQLYSRWGEILHHEWNNVAKKYRAQAK